MPETTADTGAVRRFLTFRLARTLYALPAEFVFEVIPIPAAARVPHSPSALLGLANLRGTVLPLVGLRELLGLSDTQVTSASKAIVLDAGTPVALAVESVESLAAVAADRIEVREAELSAQAGEKLTGTFQSTADAEVAKVLDIKSLLTAAFAQRERPQRALRVSTDVAQTVQEPAADATPAAMLVTFDAAGQEFALDLESVQEILPAPATLVAVPRAEALVLGVTSLRDRLLPLLSLRGLLGFPPKAAADGREKVVVMRVGGTQVGLVVDRARAILAAQASAIDPMPSVLAARTGGEARIRAIYRGDEGRRLVSILMPEQLFREDVMRRLTENRQSENAPGEHSDSLRSSELQFLVFRLGDDEFALPIEAVDEVGEMPAKITKLPKTPKFLEGVVNLRGDVLPVIDQRRRFDMPALGESERRRLVVVRTEQHRAGLIVDSVSDVLRVAANSVEPPPDLTDQIARLVRGVINLEQSRRMVLVLDPSELLTPAERGRLDAFEKASRANA
ncbi:MAG: chemotaxis protein CheW [Gammaproteobacteria bacterium]